MFNMWLVLGISAEWKYAIDDHLLSFVRISNLWIVEKRKEGYIRLSLLRMHLVLMYQKHQQGKTRVIYLIY